MAQNVARNEFNLKRGVFAKRRHRMVQSAIAQFEGGMRERERESEREGLAFK
jgi:hypothetical protein